MADLFNVNYQCLDRADIHAQPLEFQHRIKGIMTEFRCHEIIAAWRVSQEISSLLIALAE